MAPATIPSTISPPAMARVRPGPRIGRYDCRLAQGGGAPGQVVDERGTRGAAKADQQARPEPSAGLARDFGHAHGRRGGPGELNYQTDLVACPDDFKQL